MWSVKNVKLATMHICKVQEHSKRPSTLSDDVPNASILHKKYIGSVKRTVAPCRYTRTSCVQDEEDASRFYAERHETNRESGSLPFGSLYSGLQCLVMFYCRFAGYQNSARVPRGTETMYEVFVSTSSCNNQTSRAQRL